MIHSRSLRGGAISDDFERKHIVSEQEYQDITKNLETMNKKTMGEALSDSEKNTLTKIKKMLNYRT